MPQLNVVVKQSKEIWKSPDGNRTIWEVVMDAEGQLVKAKTFSQAIAAVGWSGTVVSEERQGKMGPETFVKQLPKDNFGGPRQPKDEAGIKAMWAIGQAINFHDGNSEADLALISSTAADLFEMVDFIKQGKKPVQPDEIIADTDGPIDLSKVKEIFDD